MGGVNVDACYSCYRGHDIRIMYKELISLAMHGISYDDL